MSSIRRTLELLVARLNASFQLGSTRADDWVLLSNLSGHDGQMPESTRDKLVLSLAGIQHETTISTHNPSLRVGDGQYTNVSPPVYINLLLLFVANFQDKNYPDGLEMISRTIAFFQQNPWFSQETLPGLDSGVGKITLDLVNVDIMQANYLISMMGIKYLPMVLYRLRMLPFRSEQISTLVPAVRGSRAGAG